MSTPLPNFDGRVRGVDGQHDEFVVGHLVPKLLFLAFALGMTLVGAWLLWDPLVRLAVGERANARVSRIVQQEPGAPDRVIRVRREVSEQSFDTIYRHIVEVTLPDGSTRDLRLAIDSRRKPYALVNDTVAVVFFPRDEVAFAIYQHRTWGFGAAFLLMGLTFVSLAWFLVRAVGTRIPIDPESEEALEAERRALAGLPATAPRRADDSDPA